MKHFSQLTHRMSPAGKVIPSPIPTIPSSSVLPHMSQLSVASSANAVVGDWSSSSLSVCISVRGALLEVGAGGTSSASLSTSGCADVYFPES